MKQIMDQKQSLVNDCGNGLVALFYNEEEINVKEQVQTGEDSFEEKEVKKYRYDYLELRGVANAGNKENVVNAVRDLILTRINAYDSSAAVNNFTISSGKAVVAMWLDRDKRTALMRRFEAEKEAGQKDTTLWYGKGKFDMTVDNAITLLNTIEIYACNCYDVTAAHKAAVMEIDDIEALLAYDYETGYPEQPEIEV